MKKLTIPETAEFLLSHDHYTILTHQRPDGDTVGSAAALCLGLRSLGKTAHVLENREVTPRYIRLHQGLTKPAAEPGDTIVSTDVASPNMLPEDFKPLRDRIALRIDHHGSATSFTERELVDPHSASCAELVWDVLEAMGCQPEKRLMEAVYVGLSTDTGCFRFANTNAHCYHTAAKCAEAGADIYGINQHLFDTNTITRLRMHGWMMEHVRLLKQGTVAISLIPRAVEEALGVTSDDMENISNIPRGIQGVKIAATLRETPEGGVKLSVRAVPGYDASRVTEKFGGGGHKGAAGAFLNMPLEQAGQAVEKAMLEVME